jgi:hypothetical protein
MVDGRLDSKEEEERDVKAIGQREKGRERDMLFFFFCLLGRRRVVLGEAVLVQGSRGEV